MASQHSSFTGAPQLELNLVYDPGQTGEWHDRPDEGQRSKSVLIASGKLSDCLASKVGLRHCLFLLTFA